MTSTGQKHKQELLLVQPIFADPPILLIIIQVCLSVPVNQAMKPLMALADQNVQTTIGAYALNHQMYQFFTRLKIIMGKLSLIPIVLKAI
jgi:hypothetical protein